MLRLFLPVSLLLLLYEIIFLYKTGQTLQMLNCIYLVELLLKVSHEDILGKKMSSWNLYEPSTNILVLFVWLKRPNQDPA